MLARAKRYYPGQRHQRLADNLASCSCWMCGNPRRWLGEVTMQERRQDMRDSDSDSDSE